MANPKKPKIMDETNEREREEFKSLSIRIRAEHVAKLADAKARLVYRVSSSALIERAIDLLVDDMNAKGELKNV